MWTMVAGMPIVFLTNYRILDSEQPNSSREQKTISCNLELVDNDGPQSATDLSRFKFPQQLCR